MEERGSATVENIMWLPLLLLALGAIVQFGIYFNARTAVQAAAYEAARQASIDENPAERAELVAYGFAGGILPGWREDDRVNVSVDAGGLPQPGDEVVVHVTYDVPSFFSGVFSSANLDGGWLSVTGSSATTIEERP